MKTLNIDSYLHEQAKADPAPERRRRLEEARRVGHDVRGVRGLPGERENAVRTARLLKDNGWSVRDIAAFFDGSYSRSQIGRWVRGR
ncbi:MAG TPA: hypothetical protein VM840_13570 [Actinomycetota bacterium]|nr:hypothetical protein [Actinomycetota bacterium]